MDGGGAAPPDRLSVVLAAAAGAADAQGRQGADRISATAVALLGVDGCELIVDDGPTGCGAVRDPVIAAVLRLEARLRQGPCREALAGGEPVGAADLADVSLLRWPAFARAAAAHGVRAVFAFPLRLGAIEIGVLVTYRRRPGDLTAEQWARGVVLAEVTGHLLLAMRAGVADDQVHELLADEPPLWAEVHQATGMVVAQLKVSAGEAFIRLRSYALEHRVPLVELTRRVLAGELRLAGEEPPARPDEIPSRRGAASAF